MGLSEDARLACPECGTANEVPLDAKKIRCSNCHAVIAVPRAIEGVDIRPMPPPARDPLINEDDPYNRDYFN